MQKNEINRYGNLCVEMYEILHREAPSDELNFYLSYAQAGKKILEPCAAADGFSFRLRKKAWIFSEWIRHGKCLTSCKQNTLQQNLLALRLKISKRRINSTIYL